MSALGRWSLLLVIAASCLLLPACSFTCTLVGGEDGLMVEVEVTGGRLPAGDYTIVARAEGAEFRVDETLGEGGGEGAPTGTIEVVVDGKHLFLKARLFDQSGWITMGFREGGGPADVTIEVWRGTAMLAQETYAPRYTEFRPNGDHCPPELEQARAKLVLVAPTK